MTMKFMIDDKKKYLILMRGAPGSGKTTFVAKYLYGPDTFVVCPDDKREQYADMKDEWGQQFEWYIWRMVDDCVSESLLTNRITVIDATFIPRRSILKEYRLIQDVSPDTELLIVDFSDISLEQCLKNNQNRKESGGRFVPEEVIANMHKRLLESKLLEFEPMVVSHKEFERDC